MKAIKPIIVSTVFAILALNSGCIVRSVNPWFGKQDVVFDNDLLGGWLGPEQGTKLAMTFVRGENDTYTVLYSNQDGQGVFVGTLGKIAGEYYLDFRPANSTQTADGLLLYPTHSVARLELGRDKLSVYLLNYDAVKTAAQKDRLKETRFIWDDEKELLFTAQPDDLRQFLVLHFRDPEIYKEPLRLVRR